MARRGYTRPAGRGGAGRFFPIELPERNPVNERDLGLAIRAQEYLGRCLGAQRIKTGQAQQVTQETYQIAKGIAWMLRNAPKFRATVKQVAFCCRVLQIDEPPAPRDTIPAACKVLPLKPPIRTRTGTDD